MNGPEDIISLDFRTGVGKTAPVGEMAPGCGKNGEFFFQKQSHPVLSLALSRFSMKIKESQGQTLSRIGLDCKPGSWVTGIAHAHASQRPHKDSTSWFPYYPLAEGRTLPLIKRPRPGFSFYKFVVSASLGPITGAGPVQVRKGGGSPPPGTLSP